VEDAESIHGRAFAGRPGGVVEDQHGKDSPFEVVVDIRRVMGFVVLTIINQIEEAAADLEDFALVSIDQPVDPGAEFIPDFFAVFPL